MLFRYWFLFFLSFFLFVLIHRSSHASPFVSERWGLKYVERRPLSIRGRCEHLTAHHPFDRNAQERGRGEEVSSGQLDFSVVFAC